MSRDDDFLGMIVGKFSNLFSYYKPFISQKKFNVIFAAAKTNVFEGKIVLRLLIKAKNVDFVDFKL